MDTRKIKQLIAKYFEGETTLEEEKELRVYFSGEEISEDLHDLRDQFLFAENTKITADSDFDPFSKISDWQQTDTGSTAGLVDGRNLRWPLQIAAGIIFLLTGFSAGLLMSNVGEGSQEELTAMQREIDHIQEVLVYGFNRQASASERISTVNSTRNFQEGNRINDEEITKILIHTMNNDKNVNVRLAAAEALFRFRDESLVQKALVNALNRQEDPLMQVSLIEMLVEIKASGAVNEMQKMLMKESIPEVVKLKIREGIAELNA